MKATIQILADGTVKVVTIKGVESTSCQAQADKIAANVGTIDESTRADTPELYAQQETQQDIDATT